MTQTIAQRLRLIADWLCADSVRRTKEELLHMAAELEAQPAGDLPPLPEWSKKDDLGGLVPSQIRSGLREYAQAAVSAALQEKDAEVSAAGADYSGQFASTRRP